MFSGIIEEIGVVRSTGQSQLSFGAEQVLGGTKPGDSIAVNGVCLTVTLLGDGYFSTEVMPETLRRTNLESVRIGDYVNLERALAIGDRLGGHFVQGHVDGTGKVTSRIREGKAILMKISTPSDIACYIVEKGFIAVDGTSLTITQRDVTSFGVSLVGFTQHNCTLGSRSPGDIVNLEVDIIAKYVESLTGNRRSSITSQFLSEHGFM